jgi:hypothetical protein
VVPPPKLPGRRFLDVLETIASEGKPETGVIRPQAHLLLDIQRPLIRQVVKVAIEYLEADGRTNVGPDQVGNGKQSFHPSTIRNVESFNDPAPGPIVLQLGSNAEVKKAVVVTNEDIGNDFEFLNGKYAAVS